jgi:hypothetical protein
MFSRGGVAFGYSEILKMSAHHNTGFGLVSQPLVAVCHIL